MINGYILGAIIACALVTWIPRILPFILVKYKGLPPKIEQFLQYLPVSIIFALILSSVTKGKVGSLPTFKWLDLLVLLPTTYVAFRYKNLVGTVLFGVILIALLRLFSKNCQKSFKICYTSLINNEERTALWQKQDTHF